MNSYPLVMCPLLLQLYFKAKATNFRATSQFCKYAIPVWTITECAKQSINVSYTTYEKNGQTPRIQFGAFLP